MTLRQFYFFVAQCAPRWIHMIEWLKNKTPRRRDIPKYAERDTVSSATDDNVVSWKIYSASKEINFIYTRIYVFVRQFRATMVFDKLSPFFRGGRAISVFLLVVVIGQNVSLDRTTQFLRLPSVFFCLLKLGRKASRQNAFEACVNTCLFLKSEQFFKHRHFVGRILLNFFTFFSILSHLY